MTNASPWAPASLRLLVICSVAAFGLFLSQLVEIPWRSALRGSDNTYNYLWLRSAMVGGDWDFRDDLAVCNTLTEDYRRAGLAATPTATGLLPNKYGIGWSVVSLPFYLLADALPSFGSTAPHGYGPVHQIVLQTGHGLLAVLSLVIVYHILRRWCSPDNALAGLLLTWAGSPLLYYQTSNLSMSHGVTFFAAALCLWASLRAADSGSGLRWWALAGLAVSLAAVTRFQAAVVGIIPVASWLTAVCRRESPHPIRAALVCAAAALPLIALQMFAWRVVYGQWLLSTYGANDEGFNFSSPAWAEMLFSPRHGLLHWHPFLAVGLTGLAWLARARPALATALWTVVGATLYINAAWWCWWFGAAFGQRAFDCALPAVMLGAAWCLQCAAPRARSWLFRIGCVFAALNLFLLVLYRTNLISRNGPVTWPDAFRSLF